MLCPAAMMRMHVILVLLLLLRRDEDRYTIQWHSTGKAKKVKRLNLIYADESRLAFSYRLRQARKRRAEVSTARQKLCSLHWRAAEQRA
jgi:hypothetical protein